MFNKLFFMSLDNILKVQFPNNKIIVHLVIAHRVQFEISINS